jgi:AcrR family transcriptional regulator
MPANHKSRAAILAGAKALIAEVGSYQANMIDIASRAAVSRATVYNHFTDKSEMYRQLLESEIIRLGELARSAANPAEALYQLSCAISSDPALGKMISTDPVDIAHLVRVTSDPLWNLARETLRNIFGQNSEIILRWLLGQIASPLSERESRSQAEQIVFAL